jgi:hypothetical protein
MMTHNTERSIPVVETEVDGLLGELVVRHAWVGAVAVLA